MTEIASWKKIAGWSALSFAFAGGAAYEVYEYTHNDAQASNYESKYLASYGHKHHHQFRLKQEMYTDEADKNLYTAIGLGAASMTSVCILLLAMEGGGSAQDDTDSDSSSERYKVASMLDPTNPTGLTNPTSPLNPTGLTNPMSPNNPNGLFNPTNPNSVYKQ